jgi:eukaryotic-like serine/threonine-protein kinase
VTPPPLAAALADRYRIERELGQGGMATVYLAHDLRHDRKVAVKVLKPEIAAVIGAERFLVEIKVTANLQHPHILSLHDSGEADGFLFYVMPFVEGESLRDRLTRERLLPIDDAVRIARELADALEYAHGRGVIHRDVKPENILLQSGHALVADFGIALAVQSAAGPRMTGTGISLGTPSYMSPEQASGERTIDARADVYALGAVTYEMLTGEPPFTGASLQVIVAKVLTEKPHLPSVARDTVPPHVEAMVMRALAKLPADRPLTAAAFAAGLDVGQAAPPAPHLSGSVSASRRPHFPVWAVALGALGFVGAGYLAAGLQPRAGGVLGAFGQATQVTFEPGLEITPAISPDGKQIAYAVGNSTRSRIFLRPVAGGRAVPLTDDSTALQTHPHWSHDGARILFLQDGNVFSAPSGGGPSRQELPSRGLDVESIAWSPDERRLAFVVDDSVFIRETDGAARYVARIFQASLCTWGAQDLIACMAGNRWYLKPGLGFGNIAPSYLTIIDARTGRVTSVTDSSASNVAPQWMPDGRTLLFLSNRLGPPDLYALRVNADGSAAGTATRLTVGLNANSFTLSADAKRIAYALVSTSSNVWSQPFPPRTDARATQVTFGQQTIEGLGVSPDGRWLYYDSDLTGNSDIYRVRLPDGIPERLTTDRSADFSPSPSPDGRTVAFHSWRTGSRDIFVMPLDGGAVEQVTNTPFQEQQPVWSPDGRSLAFFAQSQPTGIFVAQRDAGGTWHQRKVLEHGDWVAWSPDGRRLSYDVGLLGGDLEVLDLESGRSRRLYTKPPDGTMGAEMSRWSDDGRTIHFKTHESKGDVWIWSVPADGGPLRRELLLGDGRMSSDRFGFDIANGRIYYSLFDRQSNVWAMDLVR